MLRAEQHCAQQQKYSVHVHGHTLCVSGFAIPAQPENGSGADVPSTLYWALLRTGNTDRKPTIAAKVYVNLLSRHFCGDSSCTARIWTRSLPRLQGERLRGRGGARLPADFPSVDWTSKSTESGYMKSAFKNASAFAIGSSIEALAEGERINFHATNHSHKETGLRG